VERKSTTLKPALALMLSGATAASASLVAGFDPVLTEAFVGHDFDVDIVTDTSDAVLARALD
jgi:hypothetical protein